MYFGCTHHLSTALNVEVDAHVGCLGTSVVLHSDCCGQLLEEGSRRIILLVRHGTKAVLATRPGFPSCSLRISPQTSGSRPDAVSCARRGGTRIISCRS